MAGRLTSINDIKRPPPSRHPGSQRSSTTTTTTIRSSYNSSYITKQISPFHHQQHDTQAPLPRPTMSAALSLRTYDYPGWGPFARDNMHYTQAIRVENRIICSGQGGWDPQNLNFSDIDANFPTDLGAEIDQAFLNVETNLKHAGGQGWGQVYKVLTLGTQVEGQHEHVVRNLRKWLPERRATWTEAGVKELGARAMRFEVEVEAYDPVGAAEAEQEAKGDGEGKRQEKGKA